MAAFFTSPGKTCCLQTRGKFSFIVQNIDVVTPGIAGGGSPLTDGVFFSIWPKTFLTEPGFNVSSL